MYASTSGHTEYVVETLITCLKASAPEMKVSRVCAEVARLQDFNEGDVLLLACGTWNTGGPEGQLNPHMHELLRVRAKSVDLSGQPVAIIALGDDRYFYTCRAGEHMQQFVIERGGTIFGDPLLIVNEPYGQEERVKKWGKKLIKDFGQRIEDKGQASSQVTKLSSEVRRSGPEGLQARAGSPKS